MSKKNEDKGRKWMWCFVIALGALQAYAVRELLAVFALFVVGFVAIATIIAAFYMAGMGWQVAMARLGRGAVPVMDITAGVKVANPKAS